MTDIIQDTDAIGKLAFGLKESRPQSMEVAAVVEAPPVETEWSLAENRMVPVTNGGQV